MATTTNYGWTTPDDTALVKDGAAAIRTLGTSVDTTTKNLNPSTTLGDIEYRSSTANTNTRLAIGSTGNVLTVAGGVPSWAAPSSSGGMTLITTTTVSTATDISFTSIPNTYKHLLITWNGFYSNVANTAYMFARFNNRSSGSGYSLSGRRTGADFNNGPSIDQIGNAATNAPILGNNNVNEPTYTCNGRMWLYSYNNTNTVFGEYHSLAYDDGATDRYAMGNFMYNTSLDATGITRIDFLRNSTQTVNGTIRLWGLS